MKTPDAQNKNYNRARSRAFAYFDETCPIVDAVFTKIREDIEEQFDEFHNERNRAFREFADTIITAQEDIKENVTFKFRDALIYTHIEKLELEEELDKFRAKFLWLKLRTERILKIAKKRRARSAVVSWNSSENLKLMERLAGIICHDVTNAQPMPVNTPAITSSVNWRVKFGRAVNTFAKTIITACRAAKGFALNITKPIVHKISRSA